MSDRDNNLPSRNDFFHSVDGERVSELKNKFLNEWNQNMSYYSGHGNRDSLIHTALTKLDRYGTMMLPTNHEMAGKVFITRPKLNFSGPNLKMDSILSTLNTDKVNSVNFMIRALLDTGLAGKNAVSYQDEVRHYSEKIASCPLIDNSNPFITPLCNLVTDISGLPDLILQQFTTDTGFFSENHTSARGSDLFNKSTEISITFRDIQGGIAFAIIYIWAWYIALQCKGIVMRDSIDIYARRLNYTSSIYIFLFDPSMEVLTGWCKCTGCFPLSLPIGSKFNISRGEEYISAATKFTVPFVVNKVEYMKPEVLMDFNTLMEKYEPNFTSGKKIASTDLSDNYLGKPFIVDTPRGLELKYFYKESEVPKLTDPVETFQELSTNEQVEY